MGTSQSKQAILEYELSPIFIATNYGYPHLLI